MSVTVDRFNKPPSCCSLGAHVPVKKILITSKQCWIKWFNISNVAFKHGLPVWTATIFRNLMRLFHCWLHNHTCLRSSKQNIVLNEMKLPKQMHHSHFIFAVAKIQKWCDKMRFLPMQTHSVSLTSVKFHCHWKVLETWQNLPKLDLGASAILDCHMLAPKMRHFPAAQTQQMLWLLGLAKQ